MRSETNASILSAFIAATISASLPYAKSSASGKRSGCSAIHAA